MQDVTALLNNYRECARVLRNGYFRPEPGAADPLETIQRFEEIDSILFRALVLWNIRRPSFRRIAGEPVPFLRVAPASTGIPIRLQGEAADGTPQWRDTADRLTDLEADFRFIGYYDPVETAYVDFRNYRVRVFALPQHPELEGSDALIDCHDAKVYLLESGE